MEGKGMINLAMRGLQFLWALLVMAISGNMIAESFNNHSPSIVNYAMFCAVFAMLSLFFLIPAAIKESWGLIGFLPFALDLLNNLFWFCGAIAFAAELGAHSCSNGDYLRSNHITNGASDMSGRCREGQATTAFLWFGWAAFLVSTVLTGMGMSGSGGPRRGGARGPQMSKV